jgi:hypothetical protein
MTDIKKKPAGPALPKAPPPAAPKPGASKKKLAEDAEKKLKNAEPVTDEEEDDLLGNFRS